PNLKSSTSFEYSFKLNSFNRYSPNLEDLTSFNQCSPILEYLTSFKRYTPSNLEDLTSLNQYSSEIINISDNDNNATASSQIQDL
ncbi:13616_t:CDS:1, partial [Cetraspora pellucida]